jgi:hypothetical protein
MKELLLAAFVITTFAFTALAQTKSKVYNCSSYGASDGAIDLIVTGGRQPYSFKWSNGSNEEDLSNLKSGRYTVTITDALGKCSVEISFDISQPMNGATVDNSNPTNPNSNSDNVTVYTSRFDVYPNPTENVANIMFYNSDKAGFTVRVLSPTGVEMYRESVKDLKGEYNHKFDFTNLAKGVYFVEIKSQKESITKQVVVQ